MFVRVYDKSNNRYYKSIVYALINSGYYEKAILFNPYKDSFEIVEYLDKESKELTSMDVYEAVLKEVLLM